MNVLMLGNSFTFFNDSNLIISSVTGWHVDRVTRGGAYLYQTLDEQDEMHDKFLAALNSRQWDYVVLQEQSNAPATRPERFHSSVNKLCEIIRQKGAQPILFATWSYRDGSEKLASVNMTYEEMDAALYTAYHKAADENDALVADVGKAFTQVRNIIDLYNADAYHPSPAGSMLIAHVIINTIKEHEAGCTN